MNQSLSAAHHGYQYQDLVVACALVNGLIKSFDHAIVDKKLFLGDRFDDLAVHRGGDLRRIQIKSHVTVGRRLELRDLTTERIQARIDDLVSSHTRASSPADQYRLAVTYDSPTDQNLVDCLVPDQDADPLLPRVTTQRYRVDPARVWPVGREPRWPPLREGAIGRDALLDFCGRFIIETGLPQMSSDLRHPGPLERVLLSQLRDDVGVGLWPNKDTDPVGVASSLVVAVTAARGKSQSLGPSDVVRALGIQTDYGRVAQRFPLDTRVVVERDGALEDLSQRIGNTDRVVVVGAPGSGKSWALTRLADSSRAAGYAVATHYCYLDLTDTEHQRRATAETMFGSLIAELLDAAPALVDAQYPRYAAGPQELERIVAHALELDPSRRVLLIIDGLDHVSRVHPGDVLAPGASTHIAMELAALDLPTGVTLVVGSQPGPHLEPLLTSGKLLDLSPWSHEHIGALAEKLELPQALDSAGVTPDYEDLVNVIAERSGGNPLYATYLCREVIRSLGEAEGESGPLVDLVEFVKSLSPFAADLSSYYQWLFQGVEKETGTPWLAEVLGSIDFAVDYAALAAIRPDEAHRLDAGLSRLGPVLHDVTGQGGMRIYHESFQRFIRAKLENNEVQVANVLRQVVVWLESKGFLQDSRAFRFLLPLLVQSGRGDEVLARIGITFVADSVAHGHPGAAVLSNLRVAANVASELRDWPALVRVTQLSLAARTCYEEKLTDDLAYLYGRTFAELHCPQDLADRLLFDGRTTFSPRTGLLLCALLDEAGVAVPWAEYRSAYKIEREISDTMYSRASDTAVELADVRGWLRLRLQTGILDDLIDLASRVESDILPGVVRISGDVGGVDLLLALADRFPPGEAKALCHLELARHEAAIGNLQEAADEAQAALGEGIPLGLAKDCVALGADPRAIGMTREQLMTATRAAAAESAQHHSESVSQWVSLVKVAALVQPTLLLWVEAEIGGEGWYRAWLRFVVDLARVQSGSGDTLPLLVELAKDTDPFQRAASRLRSIRALGSDPRNARRGIG